MRSKPAHKRSRQANEQRRLLADGLCPRCWIGRRDFNPRTGKPFSYCAACRPAVAEIQKSQMRRRRAAFKT